MNYLSANDLRGMTRPAKQAPEESRRQRRARERAEYRRAEEQRIKDNATRFQADVASYLKTARSNAEFRLPRAATSGKRSEIITVNPDTPLYGDKVGSPAYTAAQILAYEWKAKGCKTRLVTHTEVVCDHNLNIDSHEETYVGVEVRW